MVDSIIWHQRYVALMGKAMQKTIEAGLSLANVVVDEFKKYLSDQQMVKQGGSGSKPTPSPTAPQSQDPLTAPMKKQ